MSWRCDASFHSGHMKRFSYGFPACMSRLEEILQGQESLHLASQKLTVGHTGEGQRLRWDGALKLESPDCLSQPSLAGFAALENPVNTCDTS